MSDNDLEGWPPHPIASPLTALNVFCLFIKSVFVFSFLCFFFSSVRRHELTGCRLLIWWGLLIAIQRPQKGPDEPAEFPRDSYFGFVALKAPALQAHETQMQPALSFPTQRANRFGLTFLTPGKFFADFWRHGVVLGAFG